MRPDFDCMRLGKDANKYDYMMWMGLFMRGFGLVDHVEDRRSLHPIRVLGMLEVIEAQEGERMVTWG